MSNIDFSSAALGLPLNLNELGISAFELPADLLGGADSVLAAAAPVVEELFSDIASFW